MFSVIIIMANRLQSCCFVFLWIVEIHGFEVRATKLGALVDDALCPAVTQSFEKIFISLLLMNVFTVVYRYSLLFWNIFFVLLHFLSYQLIHFLEQLKHTEQPRQTK